MSEPKSFKINPTFPWVRYWRVQTTNDNTASSRDQSHDAENDFLFLPHSLPPGFGVGEQELLSELEDLSQSSVATTARLPSGLQTLPQLVGSQALVLLGRPGAGKTTEIRRLCDEKTFQQPDCELFHIEAPSFEAGTAEAIFQRVDRTHAIGKSVRLVVDGADELLLRNALFLNSLEAGLQQRLQRADAPALQLIITCRAAEWPEGKLSHHWPKDQFVVARLCQLDSQAADDFVRSHLHEKTEDFWKEVQSLKIGFLCIWPHSLGALIQEFAQNGGKLPKNLFELIQRSALRQCDVHHKETDPDRAKRLRHQHVSEALAYRMSCRAAAVSCFSGRPQIAVSPQPDTPWLVSQEDFLNGPEPMPDGKQLALTDLDLEALPRLALFECVHDGKAVVYSHQLMREFLAAAWLADREFPVAKLASLLGSRRADGAWRQFPQHAAIAAWLASNPKQREWRVFLIENDPAVLFRADASGLSDLERLEIAKALLDAAVRDQAVDAGWSHRHLRGLACEGLAGVLRQFLVNYSTENEAARELAIDIVREARVKDSAADLWLAIRHPDIKFRAEMADALFEVAKEGWDAGWHAILSGEIPTDSRYTLIGAAVKVQFPRRANLQQVLPHFIPCKDILRTDTLYQEAHADIIDHINTDNSLEAVRFSVSRNAAGFTTSWRTKDTSILSKALYHICEQLPETEACAAFVEWWWMAVLYHKNLPDWKFTKLKLSDFGFEDPEKRRAVIDCAIAHPKLAYIRAKDGFWHTFERFMRLPEDALWLIQKIEASGPREARILAGYLDNVFYRHRDDATLQAPLLRAYDRCEALREVLPTPNPGLNILEHLDFLKQQRSIKDSQEAAECAEQEKGWAKEQTEKVSYWYQRAKEEFERHERTCWQAIEAALFNEKHRAGGPVDLELVDAIHERQEPWLYESARLFLTHPAEPFPMADSQRELDLPISATRALYVLWHRLEGDEAVQKSVRQGWLSHILACMLRFSWHKGDFDIPGCLLRFYPESAQALMALVRHDYTSSGDSWAINSLDLVAQDVLPAVKALLLELPPKPYGFPSGVKWLARHDFEAAVEVSRHWLGRLDFTVLDQANVAFLSAVILHLNGRLWTDIKPHLWGTNELAAKVLGHACHRLGFNSDKEVDLRQWSAEYLADITELVVSTFPPQGDDSMTVSSSQHGIRHVRDSLISSLGDRGMTTAVQRLESLRLARTERWFRQVHLSASKTQHASLWKPLEPAKVLEMAGEHDFRLVHTVDDLMNVVLTALETYQQDLMRSDKLDGRHLRHENDDTPKQENALSDQLVEWLKQRLKIHGLREVSNYDGKRTDILIQVQPPDREPLSLVVEVKKDHSDMLLEKMETQLKQLYLEKEGRTHGIYLVFWFEDGAHSAHPRVRTLEELAESLSRQAVSLSKDRFHIKSHILDCRVATIQPANPHGKQAGKRRSRKKAPAP